MVDASYSTVIRNLRAGIRENDLVGMVHDVLYRLGSDQVEVVNCISGPRSSPHPHNLPTASSGRAIPYSWTSSTRSWGTGPATTGRSTWVRPRRRCIDAYKKAYDWLYASIDMVRIGNTTGGGSVCLASGGIIRLRVRGGGFRAAVRSRNWA